MGGLSPTAKVAERLEQKPSLANRHFRPKPKEDIMAAVEHIMIYAYDVSQPNS
ncbi:transposase [Gluconacetobacter liquefaciens NRIC 0522]|nr:transposase [Gluconacetobacter liquefaciens NRIC 0522]